MAAKFGVLSKEIEGERNDEVAGFTFMLAASKTVSKGMMQLVPPTFGSEQLVSL